jgi:phosphoglycolate phosphatase
MQFKEKELIIFDLDGTLIDSAPDLALAINFMLTALGRENFSEATIDLWVGNGASILVKRALSANKIIDESIDKALFERALSIFLESYRENVCVKTVLYPNVKETLETLNKMGYKMAIVTNKPFVFVQPILEKLEIASHFSLILGGDSLRSKKPEPEPLFYVCKNLDIAVEKSVMVGDSKNDILAANAADMQSIGVSYGYNYGEAISLFNPTVVVENFEAISEVLSVR